MPKLQNMQTGEIIEFTATEARIGRLRRRVKAWCDSLAGELSDQKNNRLVMVTLTYKNVEDWRPNHIRDFLRAMRRGIKDNLVGYAWVAELQQRGAVHYHVLLLVKRRTYIPMPDKVGWWSHGSTKIETARTRYYILKYVSKAKFQGEQGDWKDFPKGLRLFAVFVAKHALTGIARWTFRLSAVPRWFANMLIECYHGCDYLRLAGGGWEVYPPSVSSIDPSPPLVIRPLFKILSFR